MIYKDGEKYNITSPTATKAGEPCMKLLKEAFPDYFEKRIPLKIKLSDRKSKVVIKKDTNRPYKRFSDVHIASEVQGRYKGLTCQWKFVQSPIMINNEPHDQNGGFSLKNNEKLIPGRDDEKLFWLWFMSREVKDNAVPDEIKKPQWKVMIEERSKVKKAENVGLREQSKVSSLIWDTEESKLREIAKALYIAHVDSKDHEEIANDVYKKVLGPEKEKLIPEFLGMFKKDYEVILAIRAVVQQAEDLEIIKREKNAKQWLIKEVDTDDYVTLVGYTSEKEALKSLSIYVAKDVNLLESLKERTKAEVQ